MLKIENLQKSFKGQVVLKNISLAFQPGETTVILGPSGSGKSTLLRTLDLLEIPETGSIAIGERTYTFPQKMNFKLLKEYRSHFSMVFQSYNLFPHLTVLENIMEGPVQVKKFSKEKARTLGEELLRKVGLLDKKNAHPNELSGGQMQRVAIVRALAMAPDFILYDEPTSALDPELAQEVLSLIKELKEEGRGQILVTHHVAFAQKVADHIVFLEKGEILFAGTSEAFFLNESPRIKRYLQELL